MDNLNYWVKEKTAFRELCLKRQDIPVFLTAQWLDAVARDSWNVINEYENGEIIAFFVFKLGRKLGLRIIEVPSLTMYSGLYFLSRFKTVKDRISKENRIIKSIINKLPSYAHAAMRFHTSIHNLQVFGWEGFDLNLRYTYQLENIKEYSLDDLSQKYRHLVKTAEPNHRLEFIDDPSIFYSLFASFLIKRNRKVSFTEGQVSDIFNYSKRYRTGKAFCVRSKITNEVEAVSYVVWDSTTAYLLISGHNPRLRNGANQYLIYLVIRFMSKYVNLFDFEGSMVESVEYNYRNMGGQQKIYLHVKHTNYRILRILESLRFVKF